MKTICLIREEGSLWATIEEYLGEVNAQLHVIDGRPGQEEIGRHRPDLIVTSAKVHHEMHRWVRQAPVIVVKEGIPPITMVREEKERNLLIAGWPMTKGRFLDITSRMLAIAPRRSFRTLVRVFKEGDDIGALGQSRDFSLSGLAFATERSLAPGERIAISFSVPEASRSLRLPVRVVRAFSGDGDGKNLYGGQFLDIDLEDRDVLATFILGE